MKLSADKLDAYLARSLAPIYLITGDEPLLVGEAADAVRAAARAQGHSERTLMVIERGFDWAGLVGQGSNMSLFAERRILELRLNSGKPGDKGSKALVAWAAAPPEDTLLLITAPKLDKKTLATKWAKALDKAGAVVQVWPIDVSRLPGWIAGRMRASGLEPDREAVEVVAARVEGNLLAARQEIDKLVMLNGPGALDGETARRAVADSARFDVFHLSDAAMIGDAPRTERILLGLKGEGVAATLVLWALTRELRTLAAIAGRMETGESMQQAMASLRVWERRRPMVKAGIDRHGRRRLLRLLEDAAVADRCIKGQAPGSPWDSLLRLALGVAGVDVTSPGVAA